MNKTRVFMRNLKWKAFHFLNPRRNLENKETYGFKSSKSPPPVEQVKEFEDGLISLVQNVKFGESSNNPCEFQRKLNSDIKKIKASKNVIVKGDKSLNYYSVNPQRYNELVLNTVTKDYKKSTTHQENLITKMDKELAESLEIEDRVEVMSKAEAYITIKDHKPDFQNKQSFRLINPNKRNIGKVCKIILEAINYKIRAKLKYNQWRNTSDVLNWFREFENKERGSFIVFDIEQFYPSITEDLLKRAIAWAETQVNIEEKDKHLILATKKTLLYHSESPWTKTNNSECDVTMGSWDGAEVCELIGLFLLSQLQFPGLYIGLYRDDGLALTTQRPQQVERIKKRICKVFRDNNLSITVEANKKIVNFLDVTFDLNSQTHRPYQKPNSPLVYVHRKSNHPSCILENIPISVNKRLSELSSTEKIFKESVEPYSKALKDAGYSFDLNYQPQDQVRTRRQRKRNITWFNPPFSKSVVTNMGKEFFQLLDRCFPEGNILHKIFNRNTVKMSYSCLPNIGTIISNQNKKVISPPHEVSGPCKCLDGECPLDGECGTSSIVYQATILTQNGEAFTYVGLTANTFFDRHKQHLSNFRNFNTKNATKLSTKVWELRNKNVNFELKWKILQKAFPYKPGSSQCRLCLTEAYFIIFKPAESTLNKRNELFSKCRHANKFKLIKN